MMLVCPECLEGKFSWVVEQVQFGAVYELENGGYTEETWKNGDIVGDDIADNGVFCCRCMELEPTKILSRQTVPLTTLQSGQNKASFYL
ncbi:hypothetical protein ACFQJ5_18765 [Halomicroarcula sp. GCM10025324]|uniref:hypothetical protein n=1 Tax=Halomicroarcula sp. GCM10025324 TaxID=3252667 RepID=UPI0036067C80